MHLNGCIFYCNRLLTTGIRYGILIGMDKEMQDKIAEFFKALAPDGARFTVDNGSASDSRR